jgi:hypothetical protein
MMLAVVGELQEQLLVREEELTQQEEALIVGGEGQDLREGPDQG